MTLMQIDRPKIGEPPLPPAPPERDPRPRREYFILPHFSGQSDEVYRSQLIRDHQNNWITIVWPWMVRVRGAFESMEIQHSQSRRYRQWLDITPDCMRDGIPPHIQFGGPIVAGEGDPTFYPRWLEYAKKIYF